MFGRAALGGLVMVIVRLLTRVSDLITMLILARLLEPKSFGIVAIAASITAIFEAALELPVSAVLFRQKSLSKPLFDTAFTLSVGRGVIIAAVTIALSIPFANFYHNMQLAPLVCTLALSPIFRGLYSPRLVAFQMKLSFWRDMAIEVGGKVIASSAAVTIALLTHSYWAIAFGTVSYPISMVVISYALAPYRPGLSLTHWREFANYLGWNSAAQIISAVNWQIERLLLGRLQTSAQLGLFSTANDIAGIPFAAVFGPLVRPLYAMFAHVTDDPKLVRALYERSSSALLAIGLPLLIGESCVAEPTVRLVLGERWIGAVPLVRWLALSFVPAVYALAASPLFLAFGHTKLFFKRNALECGFKIPSVFFGAIEFGFSGVIIARMVCEMIANAYCLLQVRRLIGLSFKRQILAGWRSPASALLMSAVIVVSNRAGVAGYSDQPALQLAILVPIGAGVYLASHIVLWMAAGRPEGIESLAFQGLSRSVPRLRSYRSGEQPPDGANEAFKAFVSEAIEEMAFSAEEETITPPISNETSSARTDLLSNDQVHQVLRERRVKARQSLEKFLTHPRLS